MGLTVCGSSGKEAVAEMDTTAGDSQGRQVFASFRSSSRRSRALGPAGVWDASNGPVLMPVLGVRRGAARCSPASDCVGRSSWREKKRELAGKLVQIPPVRGFHRAASSAGAWVEPHGGNIRNRKRGLELRTEKNAARCQSAPGGLPVRRDASRHKDEISRLAKMYSSISRRKAFRRKSPLQGS